MTVAQNVAAGVRDKIRRESLVAEKPRRHASHRSREQNCPASSRAESSRERPSPEFWPASRRCCCWTSP
jgi:hypothetical protein